MRWVDGANAIERRLRLLSASFELQLVVQKLELLHCLRLPVRANELVGEHEADVVLVGTEIRELLERPERLLHLADPLHPIGILEEVGLRVAREALLRRDASELVVDRRASGRVAQDLAAERDGVVVKSAFGVEIYSALVVIDCCTDISLAQEQIAHAIEQRHIAFLDVIAERAEYLHVCIERLVELLLLLVVERSFLQFRDVGHLRVVSSLS